MTKLLKWLYVKDEFTPQEKTCLKSYYKKMAALLLVCISALIIGNLVAWISKELSLALIYKQVTIFLYLGYIVFVLSLSFIFDKAGLSSQLTKEEFERQDMRKIKRFSLYYLISFSLILFAAVLLQNKLALLFGIGNYSIKPSSLYSGFWFGIYFATLKWLIEKRHFKEYKKGKNPLKL